MKIIFSKFLGYGKINKNCKWQQAKGYRLTKESKGNKQQLLNFN